ncbi:hypothetical protein [Nevskia sp.]|uniref:hypothetical protein n=1 Tax=Nevskia sp. TaxID=1929292 RepID=UPI0025FC21C0|nr:hypothetical protein [Nevskia sp.]
MRAISMLVAGLPMLIAVAAVSAAEAPAVTPTAETPIAEEAALPAAGCLENTGSRIKRKKGECSTSPGRVHRADDLRSTGATSAADALRTVDPAFGSSPGR